MLPLTFPFPQNSFSSPLGEKAKFFQEIKDEKKQYKILLPENFYSDLKKQAKKSAIRHILVVSFFMFPFFAIGTCAVLLRLPTAIEAAAFFAIAFVFYYLTLDIVVYQKRDPEMMGIYAVGVPVEGPLARFVPTYYFDFCLAFLFVFNILTAAGVLLMTEHTLIGTAMSYKYHIDMMLELLL